MGFTGTDIVGRRLCDNAGRVVGRVTAVYRYPAHLDAAWGSAAVTRGRVVASTHLVDLHDARVRGDIVLVSYPWDTIRTAPNHRASIGDTLSDEHAVRVLTHYRGVSELV